MKTFEGVDCMDCHCKDHLPGEWHDHSACDCGNHEHPTYTFVVTKVMEEDPGAGTVYISKTYMESLRLQDGDAVEVVGSPGCIVQVRAHPNPWADTRMISIDRHTLEETGLQLFSQVKLRKRCCDEFESVTLEIPEGTQVTRTELRAMLRRAQGVVVSDREEIVLTGPRGVSVRFRVIKKEPDSICRISGSTRITLVNPMGEEYLCRRDTTFRDVGGLEDSVRRVQEVVQLPLQHPEIFVQLGIDPPRGVLLHGPSGTGKTLIARAVAGETGCYFKSISGTEIMDKYYGESEAKLRAAFEDACTNAPAIIFIDEIDALAPRRDTAEGEVERRVTAQLLALMDGMEDRGAVMVLAATNLPNALDPALRRPGRFDREVLIGVPDKKGREEIFAIHTRFMPLGEIDFRHLTEKIHGFVGADIKALCQEAAYKAVLRILPGLDKTDQTLPQDFLDAIRVEKEDFEDALKEMRPSAGREFQVDLRHAGWDRIAGYRTEIEFLKEMVLWPIQHASFVAAVGVNCAGGLLLTGSSRVGKTLMARSLAKESGFNVIEIRGPELLSKYVGESERNIRELFRQARQMAPTVVILDGIEAMTSSGWSDSKVMDRVVHQLVMEMADINGDKPVLVVAVAQRQEDIPPALTATGRFGTELRLRAPDVADRGELFEMYLKKGNLDVIGDLSLAAAQSDGLTGGDIEELCRRVILQAARKTLQRDPAGAATVEISVDGDLLRALDRWRLTAKARPQDRL
jgi:transitional endoplasmic reticulum ATPase